jgi:hypothetical protein
MRIRMLAAEFTGFGEEFVFFILRIFPLAGMCAVDVVAGSCTIPG